RAGRRGTGGRTDAGPPGRPVRRRGAGRACQSGRRRLKNGTMSSPGLRERKKQKTRWAIQEHALRLFAEQGYDATTIDQIAAAAEVSPSTFFRYFPTKEDLVIADEYDAVLVEGLRNQPPEVSPVEAMRQAIRS